ncbi:nucleolar protein 7-like [Microcaecilia unicolor]|uniref:Nucleolar protein 7-like n=1 Tax=Microcaecilia unicolor TaxID=1415580 RepID=A0A6P7ZWT9_9AMPH|nr:nucleolar protein 7-like [Microcaecilia unicolor]
MGTVELIKLQDLHGSDCKGKLREREDSFCRLREKALLKEKRRRREELFKEQKKRKLLPNTVLEEITSTACPRADEEHTTQEQDDVTESEARSSEDSEAEAVDARLQESYRAVQLKAWDQISLQEQAAKDFIQSCLYGPGSNRTTVNQFFSLANKKGTIKKPAMQFVDNTWGTEKKQKAKRFKLRRVHKQLTSF